MTTTTRTINNNEDILDSRDIIARIEELTGLIEGEGCEDTCKAYKAELDTLQALTAQCEDDGSESFFDLAREITR